jgi:hypothetical protein
VDTTETSFSSKKSDESNSEKLSKSLALKHSNNHKIYSVTCDDSNAANFALKKKEEPKRDVDIK